jgi:hypothetical protein
MVCSPNLQSIQNENLTSYRFPGFSEERQERCTGDEKGKRVWFGLRIMD